MRPKTQEQTEQKKANNFIIIFGLLAGATLLFLSVYKKPPSLLFDESEIITYKSPRELREVYVFTDLNCSNCDTLFDNIPAFLDEGITLKLIPFPEQGISGENADTLERIWCSSDSKGALEFYLTNNEMQHDISCSWNLLESHYKIAQELKIRSSPTFLFKDRTTLVGNFDSIETIIAEIKERPF